MKIEFLSGTLLIHRRYKTRFLWDISHEEMGFDAYFDNDFNCTRIDGYTNNGRTAQIERDLLVWILAKLYKEKSFKKLDFAIHYHAGSSEEIMQLVLNFKE